MEGNKKVNLAVHDRIMEGQNYFIALMRAVNVGGHQPVSMPALRAFLQQLGISEPRSVLQSGNLVFRSVNSSITALEEKLEVATSERLGLNTEFFVRTASEWKRVLTENPFPEAAKAAPAHLLLLLMKSTPRKEAIIELKGSIRGQELFKVNGRQAYVVYPDGIGRSRLTLSLIEKKLGTTATGRNWNTALKIMALLEPLPFQGKG